MDNTNLRNMKNNVHLRDIAEIVGVNTSTVSLVLNGNARKCRISKALEDRIIDIARQLDYKPNALARSLRLGKTNIIGMIVPDISNPTFANLSRHIEKHAKDYGYRLMVCSSGEDDDNPYNLMESLVHHQLDGLIVVPTTRMKPEDMKKIASMIPLVIIDRYIIGLDVHQITFDNYSIGYISTMHLLEKGMKNIAMMSFGPSLFHMKERIDGYKQAMSNANLPAEHFLRIIPYKNADESIDKMMDDLFNRDERPDSIIFTTNMIAIHAMTYMQDKGISIPDDVKVVSMEAKPYYNLMRPSITVVDLPLKEMAERSIDLLVSDMRGEGLMPQKLSLPVKLIVRESSLS